MTSEDEKKKFCLLQQRTKPISDVVLCFQSYHRIGKIEEFDPNHTKVEVLLYLYKSVS